MSFTKYRVIALTRSDSFHSPMLYNPGRTSGFPVSLSEIGGLIANTPPEEGLGCLVTSYFKVNVYGVDQ
jgi:hypothetical protein